jgi:hypothetical protein
MNIKKVNGKYLPQLDRVIVNLTTRDGKEFSLMLTRRITSMIYKGLKKSILSLTKKIDNKFGNEAIEEFQQEALMQKTKITENKKKLNKSVNPYFVTKATFTEVNQMVELSLLLGNKKQLKLTDSLAAMRLIIGVIDKLDQLSQWHINASDYFHQESLPKESKEEKVKLH